MSPTATKRGILQFAAFTGDVPRSQRDCGTAAVFLAICT